MAIFISVLAFENETLQEQAKLSILVASVIAGTIGLGALSARHHTVRSRQPGR